MDRNFGLTNKLFLLKQGIVFLQDLNITEQLDFGIRFFDIDTIYR